MVATFVGLPTHFLLMGRRGAGFGAAKEGTSYVLVGPG